MTSDFGRRLQDLVEGIRADAARKQVLRGDDPAAARARRRHLQKAGLQEAERMVRKAEPVLSGLGLKPRYLDGEIRVEPIPGARMPESYPPWLRISFHVPSDDGVRVAVLEASWRVDDPRTPLPEAPCTMRLVVSADEAADLAEVCDFVAVVLEDFAAAVTRFDVLPGS